MVLNTFYNLIDIYFELRLLIVVALIFMFGFIVVLMGFVLVI